MLSVVIPTFNRNDLLSKCLEKLHPLFQGVPEDIFEIIVSDDNKGDSCRKMIENNYPFVKWVEGPGKGPAANRNNGVKHAKGSWIIFFDDDCLPDQNILKIYRQVLERNKNIVVFE